MTWQTCQVCPTFNSMNHYYHIYNHANGIENLFIDDGNFNFFLLKAKRYVFPTSEILAFCLLPNHFHFLIKTRDSELKSFKGLSDLFNSYTKSFNKLFHRRGSLFLKSYKKKFEYTNGDIKRIILYIHRNPIHHGFIAQYTAWQYSSYQNIVGNDPGLVSKQEVLSLFGGLENFILEHERYKTAE